MGDSRSLQREALSDHPETWALEGETVAPFCDPVGLARFREKRLVEGRAPLLPMAAEDDEAELHVKVEDHDEDPDLPERDGPRVPDGEDEPRERRRESSDLRPSLKMSRLSRGHLRPRPPLSPEGRARERRRAIMTRSAVA